MLNNVLEDGEESLPLLRAAIPRDDLDRCYVRASAMTSFTCQNFSKKKKKKEKKERRKRKRKKRANWRSRVNERSSISWRKHG